MHWVRKPIKYSLAFAVVFTVNAVQLPVLPFEYKDHIGNQGVRLQEPLTQEDVVNIAEVPQGPALSWSALGPFGGNVTDVAQSPLNSNVVLAGTYPSGAATGNLYRSTDGGETWIQVAADLSVHDIEFASGGVVYVGALQGIWKSVDNGVSWTKLNLEIGVNEEVRDVSLEPGNPGTVWIGIDSSAELQPVNIMRSSNGGASWEDVTPPLPSPLSCTSIAFDPNNGQNVFAGFEASFGGGAVWVSNDGGASWVDRSSGLPGNPIRDVVHDGTRVLVGGGQRFASQFLGLYESINEGQTWSSVHDGSWPIRAVTDIEIDPNNSATLIAAIEGGGINRSTDGGETWEIEVGNTESLVVNSARFAPGSSTVAYLGVSSRGVLTSSDSASTFQSSSDGINELDIYSVDMHPENFDEIAVAFQGSNDGGIFTSINGGATWKAEPVPPTRYQLVRYAPDGTLYAVSDGPTTIAPEGLYRQEEGGVWISIGPDQGDQFETRVHALRFSVNQPELIMLGGADFGSVQGFESTIWRSTNSGQNWEKVHEGTIDGELVTDIAFVEDGTDMTMLASFSGAGAQSRFGGVLRSVDGGQSWDESSTGLADIVNGLALCAAPWNPQEFYFVDHFRLPEGSLYQTVNGGQTWVATGYTANRMTDVACDPGLEGWLYVAQRDGGSGVVVRSMDGGANFEAYGAGVDPVSVPNSLTISDGSVPKLYVATSTGVYVRALRPLDFINGFE